MNIDELFDWATELSKKNMEAYKNDKEKFRRTAEALNICPDCGYFLDDGLPCNCSKYQSLKYPTPDYIDMQEF
jgi:hypothetical protein